jgi:hypothetical protein
VTVAHSVGGIWMKLLELTISDAHWDALAVICSDAYPFADQRNLGLVLEIFIEEYLAREAGRLGRIIKGEYA